MKPLHFDSYDQIIQSMVKNKTLYTSFLYFNSYEELLEFIYLRYNVNHRQIEIDFNHEIHLNNKLGERFATIGKVIFI